MMTVRIFQRIVLLIALLCVDAGVLYAEKLKGRVVDAETMLPLEGAKVMIEDKIPDFCTSMCTLETDSAGCFRFSTGEGHIVTIKIKFFGYHDKTVKRIGVGGNDTIFIGDIKMQPSSRLLNEAVVNAKVKRFYMRGDTVVFNPDAYHIENGERLIELVKKLPGVSVQEGKLLWNGEPVKIMMNGKEALNQNMLLNHLPSEAVDRIKAYERTSELQDRTGLADGNQEQVLDVVVKPGFMDKFLAEVEAKAYSGDEYAAKLNVMKLSDSDPIMIYGRAADDLESVSKMTMGGKGVMVGLTPTRQQIGALAYQHLWSPSGDRALRDNRWSIAAGANHRDTRDDRWTNRQVFLPETTPTQSVTSNHAYNHSLKVPVDFTLHYNIGTKNTLGVWASVDFGREMSNNRSSQETTEGEDGLIRVNASENLSSDKTESVNVSGSAAFKHYLKDGALSAKFDVIYSHADNVGTSQAEYRYFQNGESIMDVQRYSAPNHKLTAIGAVGLNKAIGKNVMTTVSWETSYGNRYRDEERWRNEVIDQENSTYRKDHNWTNVMTMNVNCKMGKFTLNPSLELKHLHEQTTYRRAALDTLARRNMLLATPSLEMKYSYKGQQGVSATLSYRNMPADMIDCIGYTDNTNPLYIRMGNPDLKTSHSLNASLRYHMMIPVHSQLLSASVDYQKIYDPIGAVMHYNSQTGGYRVQSRNVRGGNRWSVGLSYDRDFTDDLQFSNSLEEVYNRSFGIMTLVDDVTGVTYNRQDRAALKYDMMLKYEHGPWYVHTRNQFVWKHYNYSDEAQLARNLYNYDTELRTTYKLQRWNFILAPRYIIERGYVSHRMNGGQFFLNAQVNYTFMQNRATLELNGYDLLNQRRFYEESVTATSRTEDWYKGIGRYVSLTFRLKLDPKAKKNQQ